MDPNNSGGPFSFPTVGQAYSADRDRIVPHNLATSGTWPGNTTMNLNGNNLQLDGKNRRIIINDGVNDRIIIGYQASGF